MTNEVATRPKQVYEIFINATPERVWDAITKPEFTQRYFYGSSVQSDFTPGSSIEAFSQQGYKATEGQIIEVQPPHRLVHTWHSVWGELANDAPSRVTWEIEPMGESVVKLRVTH